MKRRTFIAGLASAAVWPLGARAQQATQIRRVGVLMGIAENDPGATGRIASIERPLRELAGRELGDGVVYRVVMEVQRKFWSPPDLSRANGTSRWR
jgi:hypothetical protein